MKQRITVEELMQLSSEQKEKLRAWWKPEIGDWYNVGDYSFAVTDKAFIVDTCYPLLSIGQCLEFLGEDLYAIFSWENGYSVQWIDKKGCHESEVNAELIDLLWQAVKEIL